MSKLDFQAIKKKPKNGLQEPNYDFSDFRPKFVVMARRAEFIDVTARLSVPLGANWGE